MANRDFLTVENNREYVIKLLYDKGKKQNKSNPDYADKWTWGIVYNGKEYVISATERLNKMFEEKGKDKMIVIAKMRDPDNNTYPWSCVDFDPQNPPEQPKPNGNTPPSNHKPGNYQTNEERNHKPDIDWDLKEQKTNHEIRKAICIKLAVDKIPEGKWEKKTETEIIGKFTTLMLIMSDDLELAMHKLQTSNNLHHLDGIRTKYSKLWRNILSSDDLGMLIDEYNRLKKGFTSGGTQSPLPDDDEPLPF